MNARLKMVKGRISNVFIGVSKNFGVTCNILTNHSIYGKPNVFKM